MRIVLPYPPSVNHYWRHNRGHTHISGEGRDYRAAIVAHAQALGHDMLDGRLAVRLLIYPPDRRRRDLDNVQKPLLDALAHGGVYRDDSQIDWLLTERRAVADRGCVVVTADDVASVAAVDHFLSCRSCQQHAAECLAKYDAN